MHFKANPWDFEKNNNYIIDPHYPGLYLFYSYDSYLDVYFTRQMKSRFGQDLIQSNLKIVTFEEVTFDWLQDHFESPGLFGKNESYMVLMSENIKKEVFKRILDISNIIDDRYLILNFSKDSRYLTDADKTGRGKVISITRPNFWDNEKQFDFVCRILRINLDIKIRKYLIEYLSGDTGQIISKLSMLKKMYPNTLHIEIKEAQKLIGYQELDLFKLALTYSKKDMKSFFTELKTRDIDFSELSNLFSFMIRHLMKLIDVEHIVRKSKGGRINNYNKEILSCSKLWTKEDLLSSIRKFSVWHMQARSQHNELYTSLRNEYLNCMN